MDTPITRAEHEEFRRNMESEHKRLHRRLDTLEEATRQIASLAVSVEKLAVNMENMAKAQQEQGEKLEMLESRDGEQWRRVVGYALTAAVGLVLGFLFRQLGL
jgi:chromosome segregation ATPase